jgi:hypothetical protein
MEERMSHCTRHNIYNPLCHDCREAGLTHTSTLLDDDEDVIQPISTLTAASETLFPADTTTFDPPADSFSGFDGGDSGGGGADF